MNFLCALRFTAVAVLIGQPMAALAVVQVVPVVVQGPAISPQPVVVPAADVSSGPLVAGLAGLLVLGLVFGRRKAGLPEVVS